ncbi:MAG: ribosome small subunit-dependent GTPase A [Chlamydiia bacterium]|nr:ribosome small subunit-dependent GTPase A [Chlamydiia bacterium]
MPKNDDYLDYEEEFHPRGKRESRKERREARAKDRSKYKKSDQDQKKEALKEEEPPLGGNYLRGRILSISPELIIVSSGPNTFQCTLKGVLKKEKTKQKNLITVGDWVHFEKVSADSGVIARVEKRTSFLTRAENLSRRKEQLIAANVDQVFIVMSVVSPKFKPLLVDRYILSATQGNMKPIILINKIDLLDDPPEHFSKEEIEAEKLILEEFLEAYLPLDNPLLTLSVSTGKNIDALKALMKQQTSVFAGQSGVGKSSLINATIGSLLPIGPVKQKTNKGTHTTTAAKLIPLEEESFCVDTPGIKSFGLSETNPSSILSIFPDIAILAPNCKFNSCTHLHEPDCAVKKALEEETLHPLRYASYTTLLQEAPPKDWE